MFTFFRFLSLCLCILLNISAAQAQEDPRFNISINFEDGNAPSVNKQVKQALPILWDRIITQQARPSVPGNIRAMGLLRRVRPQQDGSNIQFNPSRVWALLEKENIPHMRAIPSFNLRIELINAFGGSMQGSESEILAYAHKQADILGIQLKPNAPLLAIRIQWLDDIQVQLSARGQSRLSEFSETRNLDMGDPFIQLKRWVVQTMLRARDAYVWQAKVVVDTGGAAPVIAPSSLHLLIEQKANLSEQIALETALKNDPRVQSILPSYLNYRSREYIVQLKQNDDSWIADWFAQRGMIATPNAQGWLVH
ncbi:MAG: hypothetical protein Q9M21_02475 [Mariprofundaceae bacterium]|nr:hypothetical protein [Mariprofundaceae bacterium]